MPAGVDGEVMVLAAARISTDQITSIVVVVTLLLPKKVVHISGCGFSNTLMLCLRKYCGKHWGLFIGA
jgi:hypothetical protein